MYKNTIDTSAENAKKISCKIEQVTFNAIRKVLPDAGNRGGIGGHHIYFFVAIVSASD